MNAYELADKLENYFDSDYDEIVTMLRQQADRIAELERLVSDMRYEKSSGVYDHPHKELSDDEIIKVLEKIEHTYNPYEIEMSFDYEIRIAKAIIKASRGEE